MRSGIGGGVLRMIGLADFTGTWKLSRRIDDRMTGQVGTLDGRAVFRPDGAGLTCDETGQLRLTGQPPLTATRRYLWRADAAGIAVLFDDARPFHRFDPAADAPGDSHDCAPDTYVVQYDFTAWPHWTARWAVSGPRKNYIMESCYAPGAGAETG